VEHKMSEIDRQVFADLQATVGAEFVIELVDTFGEEAPQLLAELRAALADRNAEAFRRIAHALKSNANTFGATRFAELARGLELGGLPADDRGVQALASEFERALATLKELARG
jgi:HPt (histidine-containing phosphotransfer) domain-containing protein